MAIRTKIGKYYVIRNSKGRIMKWSPIKKRAKRPTVKQIGKKYGIKSIWD